MLEKEIFFDRYNVDKEEFNKLDLGWESLTEIYNDYTSNQEALQATAKYLVDRLQPAPEVHSLKFRIKDSEHLIEKIIRKKIEDPTKEFSVENYAHQITDLIGLRVLHLFKEDWLSIHKFITENWDLHENPKAKIRKGDPEEYSDRFKEEGCEIEEHPFGYRSIHYLVKSQPAKVIHIAEVQVRTIFEEGWSEIDHRIRYPYDRDNVLLGQYLVIFNRLAGSADEMGSFVKALKVHLDDAKNENINMRETLKDSIRRLEIKTEEKEELERQVNEMSRAKIMGTIAMPTLTVNSLDSFTISDRLGKALKIE